MNVVTDFVRNSGMKWVTVISLNYFQWLSSFFCRFGSFWEVWGLEEWSRRHEQLRKEANLCLPCFTVSDSACIAYYIIIYILWLFVLLIFGRIRFATLCQLSQPHFFCPHLSTCTRVTSLVTLRDCTQPVGLAATAISCRLAGFPAYADLAPKQAAATSRCASLSFQPVIDVQSTLQKWNTNMARSRAVEAGQVRLSTTSLDATRVPRWHRKFLRESYS